MRIFAICLERERERKELLEKQFAALGVAVEYVGVDGKELSPEELKRYSDSESQQRWGRSLTLGEVGVYMSHMEIWNRIVNEEIERALILESDAVLTQESLQLVNQVRTRAANIDMVMLSWLDCVPSFWGRIRLDPDHKLVQFARKSHGSAAYLLSRHGARELRRHSETISMPVDELMCGEQVEKNMTIRAVYPPAVELLPDPDSTSVLKGERDQARGSNAPGIKRKKRGLKRLEQLVRHFIVSMKKPPSL